MMYLERNSPGEPRMYRKHDDTLGRVKSFGEKNSSYRIRLNMRYSTDADGEEFEWFYRASYYQSLVHK